MDSASSSSDSSTTSELYFLIVKFLAGGPCSDIAQTLRGELERRKILPPRLDWLGNQHDQSFQELETKFTNVGTNHLLEICERLGHFISKENSTTTLLGSGSRSLLQTIKPEKRDNFSVLEYCANNHKLDPPKTIINHNITKLIHSRENNRSICKSRIITPKFYGRQQLFCKTLGHLSAVYCVLFDKSGRYVITGADDLLVKVWSVNAGRLLATLRGASSEITDIDINPENTLLAAGSCDKILRVWCLQTTAPVAVLSSHTGMITSVNFCPYSGQDGILNPIRYLVSTSTDGSVAFWSYEHKTCSKHVKFQPKPIQYHERMRPGQAQMICASFSPGGTFLAAGSADHHVRVYLMAGEEGPTRILEKEAHTDRVDSIQWATTGLRFVSGSKDGTALIWRYECGDWHSLSLNMYTKLPGSATTEEDPKLRLKVSMVAWAMNDQWVITAVNDHTLKVWDAIKGNLCHILTGHKDEVFVLERHPLSPGLILSAGHDGQIFLWDVPTGKQVRSFLNTIEGQGHGAVFDAKWSPDGSMAAATDSHGHILLFGLGTNERYRKLPKELFFHTDYRPLIRDLNHWVLDEQTQIAPHLMPPPFLVDVDGNPYPPELQRLVPGRELCREEQLIPNLVVTADGDREVIEGVAAPPVAPVEEEPPPAPVVVNNPPNPAQAAASAALRRLGLAGPANPAAIQQPRSSLDQQEAGPANPLQRQRSVQPEPARSNIDAMIEALARGANQQGGNPVPPPVQPPPVAAPRAPPAQPPRPNLVGMRRTGDVEGVRQSSGNWQRGNDNSVTWLKRPLIPLSSPTELRMINNKIVTLGRNELDQFYIERCKPPIRTNSSPQIPKRSSPNKRSTSNTAANRRNTNQNNHNYGTRATRSGVGVDFEDPDNLDISPSSSDHEDGDANSSELDTSDSSDSSDDSSEYSDWVADTSTNLQPPKRIRKKAVLSNKTRSYQANNEQSEEEEEDDDDEAGPSSAGPSSEPGPSNIRRDSRLRQAPKKTKRPDESPSKPSTAVEKIISSDIKEVPEAYRPSEWLSEVIPRKAPYYPQMGDEVIYLRQGHQQYINAVRSKNIFDLGPRCEPWVKRKDLRDQEFVKVIGIKYEIRPPRLCCLKLALLNPATNSLSSTFTIKYHDMPDVLDFLVLRQTYDTAMERNWKVGDQFRCMIDDCWWIGTIESHEPFESDFPDSSFQCYQVLWDNGEYEKMSPWDLEPVDNDRLPAEKGGSVPVLPLEIQSTLYQSKPEDWPPEGDRDAECQRILSGIEQVMTLSCAEPFAAPVDLNQYPTYALIVEYPIDLSTIKARLENRFYRRITSVQYDVRFIATNAEKFNQRTSQIVKQARIVTELCLNIIKAQEDVEVSTVYHELMDNYKSTSESSEQEDEEEDDDKEGRKRRSNLTAKKRAAMMQTKKPQRARRVTAGDVADPNAWRRRCRELLELLWGCQDSEPFREPVDCLEHPTYSQIIDTPMDLRTVREELSGNNYEDPTEFSKDMRLIFTNSKNFNTNNKSRIYAMTVRLSCMFEENIKPILAEWKSAKFRESRMKNAASPSKKKQAKRKKPRPPTPPPPQRTIRVLLPRNRPVPSKIASSGASSSSSSSRCSSSSSSKRKKAVASSRAVRNLNGVGSSRRPVINSSNSEDSDEDDVDAGKSPVKPPPSIVVPMPSNPRRIIIKKSDGGMQVSNGHVSPPPGPSGGSAAMRPRRALRLPTTSDDEDQKAGDVAGSSPDAEEPDEEAAQANDSSSGEGEEEELGGEEEEESEFSEASVHSQDSEDSEEEEVVRPQRNKKRKKETSESEDSYVPVPTKRVTRPRPTKSKATADRSRRGTKRVCYQEDDSDEEQPPTNPRGRNVKRKQYAENSDDSSGDSDSRSQAHVSISSRGRVRKITARARGIFGD